MIEIDGWVEKPLSEIADITSGQSPDSKFYTDDQVGMPFLQGCAEFTTKYPVAKLNSLQIKKIGKAGSILFSVRAPVGKINIADRDYIIGRGLASILATAVDPVFLEQYIAYLEPQFRLVSQGSTFEAINSKELNAWLIGLPCDPNEQIQIAIVLSTLDHTIERTEAIIAKQQRIKVGLMQDLLTKGIDDNGIIRSEATHEFKDSLLGRIPVEWEVSPLGEIADVDRGKFTHRPRNDPRFYGGDIPFIQTGDVTANIGRLLTKYSQTLNLRGAKVSKEFPEGTIAITIAANIADTAILGFPMCFPDSVVGAVVVEPNNNRFIELAIRKRKGSLDALAPQSAQKNINLETLRPLLLPKPEPEEQARIAQVYDSIDSHQIVNEGIREKLFKYKAGLMHDLLTGKVRMNDKIKQLTTN